MKKSKGIVVNKFLHILTVSLFLGFIAFLFFASSRAGLNFDSSYNLLSYQSLFHGKGFVYEYDGRKIPFDPVISTGPELYLPAFFIWKLTGKTSYEAAIFVVVAYFTTFMYFFLFGILKDASQRVIALFTFLLWFFCNEKLFGISSNFFVDPLGEVTAACLVFAGFYLLSTKNIFLGFLLFGLALDTKPNIIIALIPTVAIFVLQNMFLPEWKRKNYAALFQTAVKVIPLFLLIFLPYVTYSKIVPQLVLNERDKKVWQEAKTERSVFMINLGLGQLKDLYKNPTLDGIDAFIKKTRFKIDRLQSYFGKSYFLVALFGFLLVSLLIFSRGHFSFYIFIFATFSTLWWLFMPRTTWYRYFFISEFITILGMGTALSSFIAKRRIAVLILLLTVLAIFSLPRFSVDSLKQSFNGEDKENLTLMKVKIEQIDEKKIFTFGFLQCPQLMFLGNMRFQDFFNKRKLEAARKDEAYFLSTYDNILIKKEMDSLTKDFDLVVSYGYNHLYRIK